MLLKTYIYYELIATYQLINMYNLEEGDMQIILTIYLQTFAVVITDANQNLLISLLSFGRS